MNLTNSMKDVKSLHRAVNKITGNDNERRIYCSFDSDENIADSMTEYYSNKILKIHTDIHSHNLQHNLERNDEQPFTGALQLRSK